MEIKNLAEELLTVKLTEIEQQKTISDLQFVSLLTNEAKKKNFRIIIHGGYAVDGALGMITRPHDDIDIQIYGTDENGFEVVKRLFQDLPIEKFDSSKIRFSDKKKTTFYHNYFAEKEHFGADIYYLRLKTDPSDKNKIIIKNDGTESEPQTFETQTVTLHGISYEATLPQHELNDKLEKKAKGEKPRKEIDQDIHNLRLLLEKI